MAARPCATCGASKNAAIHLRTTPGSHPYLDARGAARLAPQSAGRTEYLKSAAHERAYAPLNERADCAFEAAGAPAQCYGPITPHHTFPAGRAGSHERAERVAPVVPACAFHNTWVSQDAEGIAWGETHWVTVGGRDWPLLMRDADARDLEAEGREFNPKVVVRG